MSDNAASFALRAKSQRLRLPVQGRLKVGLDVERLPPEKVSRGCLPRRPRLVEELPRYGREACCAGKIEALVIIRGQDILEQRLRRRHRAAVHVFLSPLLLFDLPLLRVFVRSPHPAGQDEDAGDAESAAVSRRLRLDRSLASMASPISFLTSSNLPP